MQAISLGTQRHGEVGHQYVGLYILYEFEKFIRCASLADDGVGAGAFKRGANT